MKRSLLICIGISTVALTASAQMSYKQRKAPQKPTTHSANRGTSAVRQMPSQRTFSNVRSRLSSVSSARPRESTFGTARMQTRTNTSLSNRPTTTNIAARRQARGAFTNDRAVSRFTGQTHSSSAFVNRSAVSDVAARRQYWAFRNYQPQWHDSGWWHHHCDRIVFATVYSQPFPFYFDAGYWYPAWGYYADAYYPYDGPIYGYNDLPPDEIITNVQIQLYNQGYYSGPIDGIIGPDTQAAIADYQADYGLPVTAAIDEPTVESLGLV